MLKKWMILICLLVLFSVPRDESQSLRAQCPMCKTNVESSQKHGHAVGLGLNAGILYLLAMPYLLIGTAGIVVYRHYRKQQKDIKQNRSVQVV